MTEKIALLRTTLAIPAIALALVSVAGCGLIAETDRIVVAEIDGKNITRGDLQEVIYRMPDKERPIIRSRNDYRRVLDRHIDQLIKIPLGQQLADEGVIAVDRDVAREQFFASSGDEEEQYRHMWHIPVPEPGEESEAMQIYNITAADIQGIKNIIDQGTDQIVEQRQADEAVTYLAKKAFDAGELELDPEAMRLEYDLNKEQLATLEGITFLGLQFPAADPQSSEEAARVRTRLNNGEDFDTILAEYLRKDMSYGIESDIENNPALDRFRLFWEQTSGAEVGDIVGPVYMPEYSRTGQNESGQMIQQVVPASFLVFKVIEHRPARELSFEEAQPYLAGPIAYAAMMDKLRDEHGVIVYEENLPEVPGGDEDIFAS